MFEFRNIPLQFVYLELCHYNSFSTSHLPFYTYLVCLGPTCMPCYFLWTKIPLPLLLPLTDVWDLPVIFFLCSSSLSFLPHSVPPIYGAPVLELATGAAVLAAHRVRVGTVAGLRLAERWWFLGLTHASLD